ncbi:RHS repeat domain-containing protein [Ruminococcus bovis]|nr:RHS repeat-associated core domain-containing protein [Ruminococcus bovis]
MQWKNGRQLSQVKTSKDTITYKYNIKGLRTRKDNSDYTYYYYYDDNNNLIAMMQGGVVAYFYYDSNNSVTAMSLNDTMYYYIKNLQGDIKKIVNESGNVLVEYTYDAWGKILNETSSGNGTYAHVKDFNPFRYRGYVYDTDTGLYYLQSRYYDPKTGRFINADDTNMLMLAPFSVSVLDTNLMTYSRNNPINIFDPTGYSSRWVHLAKAIYKIGKGLAAIVSAIAKGFVRSALGSFTAWALGLIIGKAIFYFSFGQWWGVVINVAMIVTLALRVKSILFDLPSGLWHLKQFFHHTHK